MDGAHLILRQQKSVPMARDRTPDRHDADDKLRHGCLVCSLINFLERRRICPLGFGLKTGDGQQAIRGRCKEDYEALRRELPAIVMLREGALAEIHRGFFSAGKGREAAADLMRTRRATVGTTSAAL